ncbi:hypothetical protein ACRALDRAFT_1061151 [Sodiomyces alcalophilus JCM 7366]|uniref:uncharacterized protein n=1 Tax=Sodiomyces alcalophilus JCM 7366 TaxID=591952 RepID=UPI0039B56507
MPPLPPSCMWGPIGPPSKLPGLGHGDTAADVRPGTARWSSSQTSPGATTHPQHPQHPSSGFMGRLGGPEGGDAFLQGRGGFAVLDPRFGNEQHRSDRGSQG